MTVEINKGFSFWPKIGSDEADWTSSRIAVQQQRMSSHRQQLRVMKDRWQEVWKWTTKRLLDGRSDTRDLLKLVTPNISVLQPSSHCSNVPHLGTGCYNIMVFSISRQEFLRGNQVIDRLIKLTFYVSLDTRQVILEALCRANLLYWINEQTKQLHEIYDTKQCN